MKGMLWRGGVVATGLVAAGYLAVVLHAAVGPRASAATRATGGGSGEQYGQAGAPTQLHGQVSNGQPAWCGGGGSPVQDVCAVSGGPELPFQAGCYASSQALGVVENIGLSAGVAQGAPQSGAGALAQCNWKQARGNAWALAAQVIDKCVPLAIQLYDLHQEEIQIETAAARQEGPQTREELARRQQEMQALESRIYPLSLQFEACFGTASKAIACAYERKGHFFLQAFGPCPAGPPPPDRLYKAEAEDPYEGGNPPPSPPQPPQDEEGACIDKCLTGLTQNLEAAENSATLEQYRRLSSRALAINKACLLQCPPAGSWAWKGGIGSGIFQCGWETATNPNNLGALVAMIALRRLYLADTFVGKLYPAATFAMRAAAANQLVKAMQYTPQSPMEDPYARGIADGRRFCAGVTALLGLLPGTGTSSAGGSSTGQTTPPSMVMPGGLAGVLTGKYPPFPSEPTGPSVNMPTGLGGVLNPPPPNPRAVLYDFHTLLQDTSWLKSISGGSCSGVCVQCTLAVDYALKGKGILTIPPSANPGCPAGGTSSILQAVFGRPFYRYSDVGDAVNTMYQAGDGALGVLQLSPPGNLPGHVFNIVNDKGDIRFLDASPEVQGEWTLQGVLQYVQQHGLNVWMLRTN